MYSTYHGNRYVQSLLRVSVRLQLSQLCPLPEHFQPDDICGRKLDKSAGATVILWLLASLAAF